jgi:hypothetical protein
MVKTRKLTPKQEAEITSRNWGYWDGVADRAHQRMAKWYRGAHKTYGHFNAAYAEGYNLGIFAGDPPPYALTGEA